MIVLVVLTIGSLWFVGHQERIKEKAKLQGYVSNILEKQKNLESLSNQESSLSRNNVSLDQLADRPVIASSTTGTSSTQDLRSYGLKLTEALKPLSQRRESEVRAVISAIDKNNGSFIRSITFSRIIHEQVALRLTKIPVPKEIESRHFKITSQMNLLVSRLKNMEKALDQPTLALENSQSFNKDYLDFIKSIEALDLFFVTNKVNFAPNEKIQIFVSN